MKKLLRLVIIVGVVAALAYGWFHQSVHYAILEIARAGREGDVATFEKHVSISAFIDDVATFTGEVAKAEAKAVTGDNIIGDILGGIAGAVAGEIANQAKPDLEMKVRRRIAQGEALEAFGPFAPHAGLEAIGLVRGEGPTKTVVTIVGTCYGEVGSVNVVFERVAGPFGVAALGTWKATGVEKGTLLILAEACKQGARKNR